MPNIDAFFTTLVGFSKFHPTIRKAALYIQAFKVHVIFYKNNLYKKHQAETRLKEKEKLNFQIYKLTYGGPLENQLCCGANIKCYPPEARTGVQLRSELPA